MFNSSRKVLRAAIKFAFSVIISVLLLFVCLSMSRVASQTISVEVKPEHVQKVTPGQASLDNHILTNTGTLTDTFLVYVGSTRDWPVELIGETYSTETRILLSPIYLPLVHKRWPPIPYKPSLNAIQGADDGSYTVDWSESPSRLADSYTLQEASDATFTTNLREVCTTVQQSCAINGKLSGTYYYRVRGQNGWGNSEWSNIQAANVLPPDTPNLNVIENADGDGYYSVEWNIAARAISYTLQEDTNPSFINPSFVYSGTQTSWSATEKTHGTYYYRVAAISPTGQSDWSNVEAVDVPAPPPGVSVLNNHTTYESLDGNNRYVVGEVFNNTASYLRSVKIAVNFFNGDQLVETDFAYTPLDNLHPYEKTCFTIELNNPSTWTDYTFEPVSYRTDGEARPDLAITTHSGYVFGIYYRILGQIRNDDSQEVSYVSAISTMYSSIGKVLACDFDYVHSPDLNPGQVSSFDIIATPQTPSAVASYTLQTDGTRQTDKSRSTSGLCAQKAVNC